VVSEKLAKRVVNQILMHGMVNASYLELSLPIVPNFNSTLNHYFYSLHITSFQRDQFCSQQEQ